MPVRRRKMSTLAVFELAHRAYVSRGLGVAGEINYCVDNGAGRDGEHARDDAEVYSQRSTQHWQHEEDTDQDWYPVRLQPSKRSSGSGRKYPDENAAAIERWERKQVKHGQDDIDEQCVPQVRR